MTKKGGKILFFLQVENVDILYFDFFCPIFLHPIVILYTFIPTKSTLRSPFINPILFRALKPTRTASKPGTFTCRLKSTFYRPNLPKFAHFSVKWRTKSFLFTFPKMQAGNDISKNSYLQGRDSLKQLCKVESKVLTFYPLFWRLRHFKALKLFPKKRSPAQVTIFTKFFFEPSYYPSMSFQATFRLTKHPP